MFRNPPRSSLCGRQDFLFFSTVILLGTPQDITLQEIRIECFFPADEETRTAGGRRPTRQS